MQRDDGESEEMKSMPLIGNFRYKLDRILPTPTGPINNSTTNDIPMMDVCALSYHVLLPKILWESATCPPLGKCMPRKRG